MKAFAMIIDKTSYTTQRRPFLELGLFKEFFDLTGDTLDFIGTKDLDATFADPSYDMVLVAMGGLPKDCSQMKSIQQLRDFQGPIIAFYDDPCVSTRLKKFMTCLDKKIFLSSPAGYDQEFFNRCPDLREQATTVPLTAALTVGKRLSERFSEDPTAFDADRHDLDIFYGGSTRIGMKRKIRTVFSATTPDRVACYGPLSTILDLPDCRGRGVTVSQEDLCRMTSRARFSLLPADATKNYMTSKSFENGFSESLCVLEDVPKDQGRYNDTVLGSPFYTSSYDIDSITELLKMDEDERKDRVKEQRRALLNVDYNQLILNEQLAMKKQLGFL